LVAIVSHNLGCDGPGCYAPAEGGVRERLVSVFEVEAGEILLRLTQGKMKG